MRMAMKAQSQCRMTIETLATLKNPQVVFAKQANINNGGQQQVNNRVATDTSRARESEPEPSKLWKNMMGNGWTLERKARQAVLIKNWRPWDRSTGPKTLEGKAKVAQNAWTKGCSPAGRAA